MSWESIAIAAENVLVGLLVIGLSIPLVRGKVRRNMWYGVRVSKSLESDANWSAINRYGGRQGIVYGVALLVVGVAALLLPLNRINWLFFLLLFAPVILAPPIMLPVMRFAAQFPDSSEEKQDEPRRATERK
jgi:hypothetical protein